MDVSNHESISNAQKELQVKEGKLHILINKYVFQHLPTHHVTKQPFDSSAGQVGPMTHWYNDLSSPEHKTAETLGRALFESQSFESWAQLHCVNTFAIFFVTTAFLGLLAKGSEDRAGYTSCVINISSITGHWKLAGGHVHPSNPPP